jgi:hypothetical protein
VTNEELGQLEKQLVELRTLYDNYFAGIERREPLRLREELQRRFRLLTQTQFKNTQIAFRVNNLRARMSSYESYWNRIAKQIEEGTFKRDKLKAQRILQTQPAAEPQPEAAAEPKWVGKLESLGAPLGAAPPASATATAKQPPKSSSPEELSETRMRALYDRYAASRKQLGETPVSYDAMVGSLKKQMNVVREKYPDRQVEFKVAQKDGRTVLKAVPTT